MERFLSLLERFKTPITVVIVIAIFAVTGLLAIHTTMAEQLVARSTSPSDDKLLKDLEAKQQAIMAQLATIKLDAPAGLPATDTSPDAASPSSSIPAGSGSTTTSSSGSASSIASNGLVRLNTADEAALETLPDIGPSKAQAIIDYRTAHGGFKSIEELDNVKGIGAATLAKLKPRLTLD